MKIDSPIGNVQLMQKINRLKVISYIRQRDMAARPEIAKITGLSPSSITNITSYLLDKKIILEVGTVDSKEVGRKATLLKFNAAAWNIISIDIETSKVNIALTDLEGTILNRKEIELERFAKDFEILNMIKKEINILISKNNEMLYSIIAGIGIAVSGIVEDDEKLLLSSSLRWRGVSLKDFYEDSFHIPVYVQNNSRTKAISELKKGNKVLDDNIIFLDLTMGVGIISFYKQKINEAIIGELGHTTVKKDGPLCFCGNHGCLEVVCSVDAIINQCMELIRDDKCKILKNIVKEKKASLSFDLILEAFDKGDTDVYEVLKECAEYLGIGIANIINIFNPQRIIINGDLLLTSDFIYKTAVDEANKRAYEQFTKELKYEKVNITMEQSIKGVSLYVSDKLFELSGPEF